MNSIYSLQNRVAIVSGAGSGIGAGTARVLANHGATVVIAEIDEAKGVAIARSLQSEGLDAKAFTCDVSDSDSVREMVGLTTRIYGQLDILVNNAGRTLISNIDDMSPEDWDALQNTNLRSMFLLTKACLPALRNSENAAIINISSVNASVTLGGLSGYAASKAGIVGFTKSLAAELAPNIRVNAIAPGAILTEAWQQYDKLDEVLAHRNRYIPLERLGSPEDVGNGVAFLASDMAAYITGTALTIDGGMTSRLYDGQL